MSQPQPSPSLDASVTAAERHARHHYVADGLAEIATGVLFLAIGALFVAEARAGEGSLLDATSALLLPLLLIGGMAIVRSVLRRAKERITIPRAGYVSLERERPRRSRLWAAAVAAAMAAVVAFLATGAPRSLEVLPAADGLIVGAFLAVMAWRMDVGRFYALAIGSVAIGATISLWAVPDPLGSGLFFSAFGGVLVVSGLLVLARFLEETDLVQAD